MKTLACLDNRGIQNIWHSLTELTGDCSLERVTVLSVDVDRAVETIINDTENGDRAQVDILKVSHDLSELSIYHNYH